MTVERNRVADIVNNIIKNTGDWVHVRKLVTAASRKQLNAERRATMEQVKTTLDLMSVKYEIKQAIGESYGYTIRAVKDV